jgi:hypothetical protein
VWSNPLPTVCGVHVLLSCLKALDCFLTFTHNKIDKISHVAIFD